MLVLKFVHLIIERALHYPWVPLIILCYLPKCCSATVRIISYLTLLHACITRIHVHELAGLLRVSETVTRIGIRAYNYIISACASMLGIRMT